jgi:hypothetical protein
MVADGLLLPREELYRVAGYLRPLSPKGEHWERMKYKYLRLSSKNQDTFSFDRDFELMAQRRRKAPQ